MAGADPLRRVRVVLSSLDVDDMDLTLLLPLSVTARALREAWASEHRIDADLVRLRLVGGAPVRCDAATVADLAPRGHRWRSVDVLVEERVRLGIRPRRGQPGAPGHVSCWLSATPGEIEEECRRALGVEGGQTLRLFACRRPLKAWRSLREQRVGAKSTLEAEVVRDEEEEEEEGSGRRQEGEAGRWRGRGRPR